MLEIVLGVGCLVMSKINENFYFEVVYVLVDKGK